MIDDSAGISRHKKSVSYALKTRQGSFDQPSIYPGTRIAKFRIETIAGFYRIASEYRGLVLIAKPDRAGADVTLIVSLTRNKGVSILVTDLASILIKIAFQAIVGFKVLRVGLHERLQTGDVGGAEAT
jgi:hypothetical protein